MSSSSFSESHRQIEHILPIGFAFLLEILPYSVVVSLAVLSVFYGVFGSRWLLKEATMRETERAKKFSWGKFLYGFMVLCLVLIFPDRLYLVGVVWAILACGDGFSNLFGRRFGTRKLPWNTKKSWVGMISFFLSSFIGAFILLWWLKAPFPFMQRFYLALIPAFICALVETIPWKLDDNFSVVVTGAFICHYLDLFLR